MRFDLQYVQDGKEKAVQIPLQQWNLLLKKLSEIEFSKKFASDLRNSFADIDAMQSGKKPKKQFRMF